MSFSVLENFINVKKEFQNRFLVLVLIIFIDTCVFYYMNFKKFNFDEKNILETYFIKLHVSTPKYNMLTLWEYSKNMKYLIFNDNVLFNQIYTKI